MSALESVSAIRSIGRRGATIVPNWRWEDDSLDPHQLRIAGWLASHADGYCAEHVTRNEIARRTGVSQGKVSSALAHLESLGLVTVLTVETRQSEGGKRLVITFDFDAWETPPRSSHDRAPRSPRDQAPVTTRPDPGHVVTATRGLQEEEQGELSAHPSGEHKGALEPERFDEFWALYPRRVGKRAKRTSNGSFKPGATGADKAWVEATADTDAQVILDALAERVAYWERHRTPKNLIPHPTTWLNGRRWEDEIEPTGKIEPAVSGAQRETDRVERQGDEFRAALDRGERELAWRILLDRAAKSTQTAWWPKAVSLLRKGGKPDMVARIVTRPSIPVSTAAVEHLDRLRHGVEHGDASTVSQLMASSATPGELGEAS